MPVILISWEGHLWGAISGVLLAFVYRKYLIRRDKFDWEDKEEEDDDDEWTDDQDLTEPGRNNILPNNVNTTL